MKRKVSLNDGFPQEKTMGEIDYREVTRLAYELYEQRGRVDGHDLGDWLKAEEIVCGKNS